MFMGFRADGLAFRIGVAVFRFGLKVRGLMFTVQCRM